MERQPVTNTSANPPRSRITTRWLCRAAVVLPFLVLAVWSLGDGPGFAADDHGQYLMHAKALADGRPYTDIGYIYSRYRYGIGPATALPGLPLLLAAIQRGFGPDLLLMRLALLCFAVTFVAAAGFYFARRDDPRLGAGVALLVGLSPGVVHASSQILTDLPFAAIVWLIIYLADKPGPFGNGRVIAITLLGIVAASLRIPAVALFPALLIFAWLHRREHGWRPALPIIIWLAAFALLAAVVPLERLSVVGLQRILAWDLADARENIAAYWPAMFDSHLHPFPWPIANDILHVFTGVLMAIGLAAWLRGAATRFAAIFALVYGVMLFLLPLSVERYLWPLFPLFVFGMLNGIAVVAHRYARLNPERATLAALVCALVLVPPAMADVLTQPRRRDLMQEPEVQRIVALLRDDARGDPARVVFYKPRSFAWATGVPAMGAIGGSPACLVSELVRGRITHVVLGSITEGTGAVQQRDLMRLQRKRPHLLVPVGGTQHFQLYRFHAPASEAAASKAACRV